MVRRSWKASGSVAATLELWASLREVKARIRPLLLQERMAQGTVEGRRWAIENAFETARTELGLAHNETRSQAEAGTGTSGS